MPVYFSLADAVLKMYRLPAAERVRMGQAGREYYHRGVGERVYFIHNQQSE